MEQGTPAYIATFSFGITALIIVSLLGNLLVCIAVYASHSLRQKLNYMIVSLALADIIIATVCMPIWLAFEVTGFTALNSTDLMRIVQFSTFADVLGGVASIVNLTAISYERLYSVCAPLKHRRCSSPRNILIVLLLVWGYALVIAGTNVLWWDWYWLTLYTSVLGFFVPLLLIVAAYLGILLTFLRSPRHVISRKDNFKITRTISVIIGIFVLSWAPFFISSLLSHYCLRCHAYIANRLWLRSLVKWLHYGNSCVNPIIYGFASAQYKDAFKTVLSRMYLKCCPCLPHQREAHNCRPVRVMDAARSSSRASQPRTCLIHRDAGALHMDNATLHISGKEPDVEYPLGDYRSIPCSREHSVEARSPRWSSACSTESSVTLLPGSLSDPSYLFKINPDFIDGLHRAINREVPEDPCESYREARDCNTACTFRPEYQA